MSKWIEMGTCNQRQIDTLVGIEQEGFGIVCAILDYEGESVERILRAVNSHDDLLSIVKDILPDDHSDYSDGERCDECGTRRESSEQTQCDVPGCWYVRIREAVAKAEGRSS